MLLGSSKKPIPMKKLQLQSYKQFLSLAFGLFLICGLFVFSASAAEKKPQDYIPSKNAPAVVDRIFSEVFGKKIKPAESEYWKKRARRDKTGESALKGAMAFQKSKGLTMPKSSAVKPAPKKQPENSNQASGTSGGLPLLSLSDILAQLDGVAVLIANDGTYLGLISSNQFNSQSIANEFGTYGSKFSSKSIFNEFGRYGGSFSSQSPFNKFTSTPPRIFIGNTFIGYLTVNSFLSSSINPYSLIGYLTSN